MDKNDRALLIDLAGQLCAALDHLREEMRELRKEVAAIAVAMESLIQHQQE